MVFAPPDSARPRFSLTCCNEQPDGPQGWRGTILRLLHLLLGTTTTTTATTMRPVPTNCHCQPADCSPAHLVALLCSRQ